MSLIAELTSYYSDRIWDWPARTAVLRQGGWYDSMFVLLEGQVEVWTDDGTCSTCRVTVGPGAILGEASLFVPGPAASTIRTTGPCRALRLSHADIEGLWNERPVLARRLMGRVLSELTARLRLSSTRPRELGDVPSWI